MQTFVVALALGVAGCNYIPGTPEHDLKVRMEESVKGKLKDPSSAMFNDVEYFTKREIACGKVNAKNEFGGYVGAFEFAYHEGSAYALEWDGDPNRYLWVRHECLKEHIIRLREDNPGVKFDDPGPFKPV